MPKDSCIDHHKRGDFIILRRHMVDIFEGDHCAAVVIAYFEYATSGELDRFSRQGVTGIPWVTATMTSIYEETTGLYSIRRLQERIAWLVSLGFIQEDQDSRGKVKRYLLDVEFTNDCILKKRSFSYSGFIGHLSDGPSDKLNDGSSDEASDEEGGIKSLGVTNLEGRIKPSVGSKDSESQPQTPEDPGATLDTEDLLRFLPGKFKRLKGGRSVPKDLLRFRLEALQGISTEEVYRAFDSFSKQDFWEKFDARHRVNAFFVYLQKREGEPEPKPTSPRPEIPVPVAAAPVAPAIDFPDRWNELVPARPTVWNQARDSWRGVRVFSDPEFAAKFDDLCRTCQKFIAAKPDADWVHFRWMIGSKDGHPNWHRVDSEEFQISEKRHGSGKQSGMTAEDKAQMTRDTAKQMREEYEARKKAAVEKS